MRFSLFAVLSGLAALAVVSALPSANLQPEVPSAGDVNKPSQDCDLFAIFPACGP
ncbi:hypothetical protein L210DRAFT_3640140 [Boletus edulis BED1]|uniref:Uncharacterized protein n=1 Tax=Boletus edulis BED1 TaxID=1328754 RepID=A0AAD4C8A2_BOLED|nr:hypothetical protein L210DRAFT_3658452 [Boletus edulis BED1]KAF8451112.1 hypothetical protein L210DRAFT_3640140 [Boletus edulis BED1]